MVATRPKLWDNPPEEALHNYMGVRGREAPFKRNSSFLLWGKIVSQINEGLKNKINIS